MTEEDFKKLAEQLRKPHGKEGVEVGKMMNPGNLAIYTDAMRALNIQDQDRLLEIGPGNGFFVKDLLSKANEVTYAGCDFSELMVEQCHEMNREFIQEGRAQFVHAECHQMPFEPEAFTKILTVNTIYFWPDPMATLNEFHRVLTPSGTLTIALRPEHKMKNIPFTKHGFAFWTEEKLYELFEASPFSLVSIEHHIEPTTGFAGRSMQMENYVVIAEKH
jgi:ubiquinone/menaquinone biosynthesis C-methylase UbiE